MKYLLLQLTLIPLLSFANQNLASINEKQVSIEYNKNISSNHSIFNFIGVWNFGKGSETLNISKGMVSDSIQIIYNSVDDSFEDRFFENCFFENGKIYGDYYGGKKNVILEIEQGNLLLTINPYHQFEPLKKQQFKKSQLSSFSYISQAENVMIKSGKKTIDSLPPGDRVLLNTEKQTKEYTPTIYYNNRFNKTNSNEKKNRTILTKALANTKPLFASENVSLQYFERFNKSELFVKKIYPQAKYKEHLKTVTIQEQNRLGQKILFIDKATYEKLSLKNIVPISENTFITGTVDLSPKHITLVIDFQYDNEFSKYLVNYNLNGRYIDHILIGKDDYVESFTPINTVFSPDAIYVNYQISNALIDDINVETFNTFKTRRYVLDINGRFLESNYDKSVLQTPEKTINLSSQEIESQLNGMTTISLNSNYLDTINSGGYISSLATIVEVKDGITTTLPIDFSEVAGFYNLPYGNFIVLENSLEQLFSKHQSDGLADKTNIKFHLIDLNKNTVDELVMEITDNNYVVATKHYLCFENKGGSWVYYSKNELANESIRDINLPFKLVFESFLTSGNGPQSYPVATKVKEDLLLKGQEELIVTFKIKDSKKRVTIGIDKQKNNLIYRFGSLNNIEMDYVNPIEKFTFISNDLNLKTPRNQLEYTSFINEDFEYTVYNNYLETNWNKYDSLFTNTSPENYNKRLKNLYEEGKMNDSELNELSYLINTLKVTSKTPNKNGIGIMIRNIKTNTKTFIIGDEKTIQGALGLIKENKE